MIIFISSNMHSAQINMDASPAAIGQMLIRQFALPMTRREFVGHLVNGTPVEIPRLWLFAWWRYLESLCAFCELQVACDKRIAQITPVRIELRKGVVL